MWRGAQTHNPFEGPFWVHVWGVEGKTWQKFEVNQSISFIGASFFVNISPALIFVNVCPFRKKQIMTGSSNR
jgi:hypothetical protein